MALRWTVIVIDRRTWSDVEQDVTEWYAAPQSSIARRARGTGRTKPSKIHLELDPGVDLYIAERCEVWVGWRDPDTLAWAVPPEVEDRPVGGYIDAIEGGSWGDKHVMDLTFTNYDLLFRTTDIIGWPTGASDGFPTAGFPPDESVTTWLVGDSGAGAPYNGLIRARWGDEADLSGVDPLWDSVTLPLEALPGNDDFILGQWGFCSLDKALQDLCGAIRFSDPGREPVYFTDTGVDGTVLRARFRFIDAQDTTAPPVADFSVDPGPGEVPIE